MGRSKRTAQPVAKAEARIIEWGICGRALCIDISDAASQAKLAALKAQGVTRSAEPRIAGAKGHRIIAALLEADMCGGSMPHVDMGEGGWVVAIEAEFDEQLPAIESALRAAAKAVG